MPDTISGQELEDLVRRADEYFRAENFSRARPIYVLLHQQDPLSFFFFAREIEATIRSSNPAAADRILRREDFPANDDQFFWGCHALVEARRFQQTAELIEREQRRDAISSSIIAAAQARLFASSGSPSRAQAVLAPPLAEEHPPVVILRLAYFFALDFGNLDEAIALSSRAALLSGDISDCRFAFDLLTFSTDYETAQNLLDRFRAAFPQKAQDIDPWYKENLNLLAMLKDALGTFGPPNYSDRQNLKSTLSSPQIPPNHILWAKHTLMHLIRSEAFLKSDFELFGEYLPSWEDGRFKTYILYRAKSRFADWPRIQEQWLRLLIVRSAFGDAVEWLSKILPQTVSDDIVYFALMILRLSRAGVTPQIMDKQIEDTLLAKLAEALPQTSIALRSTLFEHIEALGLAVGAWHPAMTIAPGQTATDAPLFRRLLGLSTGRLSRVAYDKPFAALAAQDAKIPHRTSPKAVFIISGQLRGFETAWPSLYRHVVAPAGLDVLMTVWDKTANATGRHAKRLERALPDDVVAQLRPEQRFTDIFEQEFPKTAQLLFGETNVFASEIAATMAADGVTPAALETENDALLMQLLRPTIQNGMMRMYYRFARAERLLREHEIRSGIAFSHVIWSRPDFEITKLPADALQECMAYDDIAFSSWVTENSVGDYFMVLPRLAFTAIASVFSRVVMANDATFLPWRPKRESELSGPALASAFGGPETICEVLMASGFVPLGRISGIQGRLLGRTPPADVIRNSFAEELRK
jgi:hypothetical protein